MRAEDVPETQLLFVVVPQSTAAVQIHHQGMRAGCLRPEQPIGHRQIARVCARLELLVEPGGLPFERLDQRHPLG